MLVEAISLAVYAFGLLGLLSYLIPICIQILFNTPQDLKKLYGLDDSENDWALVTGGSSGIGKAIVQRLVAQGINVIVVALDDHILASMKQEFEADNHRKVNMRWVGVDLGSTDPERYMGAVRSATRDVQVRMVFNNAGFILPGIFHGLSLEKHLINYNCNSTSAVVISHHFLGRMASFERNSSGKRGLITFTSSSAGFLPTPISALYGATKTFLTSFASSISAEVKEDGIDVLCIHPSPTQSNFYNNAKGISLLTSFQKTAVTADSVALEFFKAAGRCTIRDLGYFSVGTKLILKLCDYNLMAELTPYFMRSNVDFRKLKNVAKEAVMAKEE